MNEYSNNFLAIIPSTQIEGTDDILIDYEECKINTGSFNIGLTQAIGKGVVKYSVSVSIACVIMSLPIQDTLTMVVRDCYSQ